MNLGAILITVGVGILCYILGRIRGFFLAVKWLASVAPEESEFVVTQRENAPLQ